MNQDHRKLAADFIKTQYYAVVSSIWNGEPQAATVAFSSRNDFEIVFSTCNTTRKYRNLKKDGKIAVVIGWDKAVTIQLEGVATEATGELLEECKRIHIARNPDSEKYADLESNRYFLVTPHWIRYTDISDLPEFVFEIPV